MATVLAASAVLSCTPAFAAGGRRRAAHPTRRLGAQVRRRHHRPRCVDAHARIGRVPRAAIERATVCLLNHERTERGLPRLRASRLLTRSAQRWTNTMVRERAFTHGADFSARITAVGFDWQRAGENIADGYRTAAGAVRAWMRSVGHCQNILTPVFRDVGAGFDRGSALGGGTLRGTWTLDLALGMHQRALSENWKPAEGCPYRG
ncbi:MAG TPA: CAP domain-containing protein [Solirubrobacteraceae bacterium]|nr:CAP domain-containing protein [Solirubrobacteraceae bacterium]